MFFSLFKFNHSINMEKSMYQIMTSKADQYDSIESIETQTNQRKNTNDKKKLKVLNKVIINY